MATPTKNCFDCWSLVLLFILNDNRVESSVTVSVMTSETIIGYSRQNASLWFRFQCHKSKKTNMQKFQSDPAPVITVDQVFTVITSSQRHWTLLQVLKIVISTKTNLVTSNGELLILQNVEKWLTLK